MMSFSPETSKNIDVLIIDNKKENLNSLNKFLSKKGLNVNYLFDELEAIQIINKKRPSVILSETNISHTSGFEICKSLKTNKNTCSIPIILLSNSSNKEVKMKAFEAGAEDFISAPFIPEEVYHKIIIYFKSKLYFEELEKSNKKLKQQEHYYRSLLFNLHEDIIVIDKNYKITDVNNTFLRTTNHSREQIIGKRCFEISHNYNQPCDKNGEDCKLKEVFQTGEFQNCVHIHKSVNKSNIYIDILLSPLKDEQGNVTHVIETMRDITNIKTVEDSLYKSEEKFRNLVESSSDWIWELDQNGVCTYSSPQIESIMGYKPYEMQGNTPLKFMEPKEANRVKKILQNAISKKEPISHFETKNIHKKGHIVMLESNAVPFFDNKGNIEGYRGVNRDITARKLTEKALQESENKYKTLIENQPIGVTIHSRSGEIVYANPALYKMLCVKENEDIIGKNIIEFVHPVYAQKVIRHLQILSTTKPTQPISEEKFICNDGKIIDVEINRTLIKYKDEKAILVIISDISERKKSEEKLQKSEEKFRNLVEIASDWVWELTIDGVYTYSSPKIEEILGYKAEEIVGKHPIDFMPEDEVKRTSNEFVDIIKAKRPFFNYEFVKHHKNGKEIIVESSGMPILDKNKELVGYRGVSRDITARKRVEKERTSYLNFLKNLNQINTIIQKSNDIDKILWDVLNTTLSIYNCDRAWLLYPCEKDSSYLQAMVEVSTKEFPGVFKGDKIIKNINPTEIYKIVLKNKQPVCFGPEEKFKIPTETIKEYNILSQLAMAIYPKTDRPWVFGIHQCSNHRKWTKDEITLFNEIGHRIEDSLSLLSVFKNLQNSEENYRTLFENSPLGIYRTTPEGEILMANPALLKMLDYNNLKEIQKINLEKDIDKKIYPRSEYKKILNQKGIISGFSTKFIKKDGSTIDISESAQVIKNDNGKIIYYEGWIQDITLRKKVEKALYESEQKFRNLFNSSSDGIIIFNQDYNILSVNKTLIKLTGFKENQLLNNKIVDLISPQYVDIVKKRIKKLFENIILSPVEIEIYHSSDKTIPIELNSRKIEFENEKAILTILRDISYRKDTERKVLNAIIETEEREKEKFARDLHDGLGPLLSATKIYSKSLQLTKKETEQTPVIKRLEEIIDQAILVVQEISNNLSPHVLKNIGLVAAIKSFYQKISDATSLRIAFGTNLEIRISEKIEITLYRVAVELINNTLKHSNASSVMLKLLHEGNNLTLHYSDNGNGFNIDKTLNENTGMGLSNIISRIKSLNGDITMNSSVNKGYSVKIKIVL